MTTTITTTTGSLRVDDICDIILNCSVFSIDDQDQVITNLLCHVGFRVTHLEHRVSTAFYTDEDGSATNKTFDLNRDSKIKICNGTRENQRATIWLNNLWSRITPRFGGLQLSRDQAIQILFEAIEKGLQLRPIILTEFGETLLEPLADSDEYHTHDDTPLKSNIGVHDICNGWVDLKGVSETHQAIVCRSCQLRVVIPKIIETYGELRKYFVQYQH